MLKRIFFFALPLILLFLTVGLLSRIDRAQGKAEGRRGEAVPSARAEASGSSWLIAGPFGFPESTGLEDELDRDYLAVGGGPGEGAAAPLRIGKDKETLWVEAAKTPQGYGGVDFIAELGQVTRAVAYAYREIASSGERRMALKLGSDDGVKIWVNGELVLANHVRRSLTADEDSVAIQLREGRNRILVKVAQATGEWGFKLRLLPIEEDRAAAAAARLTSIGAFPDSLAAAGGKAIGGVLMSRPAYCSKDRAAILLEDESGSVLSSAEAELGGRFSLHPPSGLSGLAFLRVKGGGSLASLPSSPQAILLGDAAAIARDTAAAARLAAKRADPSDRPTLEFLALCLEGKLPDAIGGFDKTMAAYLQVKAMAGEAGGKAAYPRGLNRYAYRSALDGSLQPYSAILPRDYDAKKKYGLVVALHGATGNDYDYALGFAQSKSEDMIILSPYGRGDLSYTGAGERDVLDAMDEAMKRFPIDERRVYLTGSSMGGYGTWRLAKLYPWKFAAAAPFAGWTNLDMLENLIDLPLLVVHGDADPTVPDGPDRAAVDFLSSNGGEARLDILPGVGHNAFSAWTAQEGPDRLLAWFRQQARDSWPKATGVRATMARAGKGSWASILGVLERGKTAAVEARIEGERRISVDTENVSAFELDLRHPGLAKGGRVLLLVDGFNLTADSGRPSVRFELGPKGRFRAVDGEAAMAQAPNPGSGLAALAESPLVMIYGTAKRSRAGANEALARSLSKGLEGLLSVRVLSDSEYGRLPPSESGEIRVFVGSPEDNRSLSAIAPRLPVAWKDGSYIESGTGKKGRGLLLVCPDPDSRGRLMGLLSLPMDERGCAAWARGFIGPLYSGAVSDPCGFSTPDATLLDERGAAVWTGNFDWRWEKLEGNAQ